MTLFYISRYLELALLPPGINLLLVLIGMGFYCYFRRLGQLLIFLGFLSLWLASAPIIAYNLLDVLQNQYPTLKLENLMPHTTNAAIVILGGGDTINVEQGNRITLSDVTLSRVRYAAYLHKKLALPLIVSGGKVNGASETGADLMLAVLQNEFNITNVIKEDESINTAEEGKYIAVLLKEYAFDKILLVTNAWHMPRSIYSFQKEGIDVIPAPMGYEVYDHHYTWLSYLPNIKALQATATAMHEFIGLFWYYLSYLTQNKPEGLAS